MNEALKQIYKERKYHQRQIEENLAKIESRKESIQFLEEATEKEKQLVAEFDRVIEFLEKQIKENEDHEAC